ncbi:MAG: hypothetical protein Q8Q94_00200 [bacterium]|nr:hypothetical protein [bacterium]
MFRIHLERSVYQKFVFVLALALGVFVGLGASVYATSIGGDVSVTGTLTTTGATTLNGGVTLGDAAADTITVNGTLTAATVTGATVLNGAITLGDAVTDAITWNAGTSTIGTTNNAFQLATSSAPHAFFGLDAATYRVGIGTGTPGAAFAVGGDGTVIIGNNSSATTTLTIDASSSPIVTSPRGKGGCINMRGASDGVMYRVYIVTGGTLVQAASSSLRIEEGSCR